MPGGSSKRFAVLLRGVNVGGVTVRSADLREALAFAGLHDVSTVLASGNAVVTGASMATVRRDAEQSLAKRYGRTIRTRVISITKLRSVVDTYPFPETDATTPYVVFALESGVIDSLAEVSTTEQTLAHGDLLYWANPVGTSTTSAFARALVKVGKDATTTRNLRTLRKVIAAG